MEASTTSRLPLFLGLFVPVDVLGGLAADPADEFGDLGVNPHSLGCAVIGGKLFRCEDSVELAVADDVDGLGSAAAPRFRQPVMPVGARSLYQWACRTRDRARFLA